MALTQTLVQLRTNLRLFADVGGANALLRHPDSSCNDYLNRGIAALYRVLETAVPDQRFLAQTTVTTAQGTSLYALPSNFDHLISVDLSANGLKSWLIAYEMHERPALTDPSISYTGIPFCYRLQAGNVELLPVPQGVYTATLWYVPSVGQLSADSDTTDTISRLDDYVLAYAGRLVGVRDKNWQFVATCKGIIDEIRADVEVAGRSRDKNSPPRVVDESQADRWGRRHNLPRRWR